jgi:hypothetical protein
MAIASKVILWTVAVGIVLGACLPAAAHAKGCKGCGNAIRLTAHAMPHAIQVSVLGRPTEGFIVAIDPNKPMVQDYYCYCNIGFQNRGCLVLEWQEDPTPFKPAGVYRIGEGQTDDHWCEWRDMSDLGWVCWNVYGCP